jgi:HK97 family phage major capsid protein/HK97 family phage prohead protease
MSRVGLAAAAAAASFPPAVIAGAAARAAADAALGREHWAKATQDEADPFRFIVSTEAVDRMGDVILLSGWRLANFKKNPIALFQHNASMPIGRWEDIKAEGDALTARLVMAEFGTSPMINTIRSLLEQRILRACSVGFRALKVEPLEGSTVGGLLFKEQELLEISVVSIPANQQALSVARSFHLSSPDMARLFAPSGNRQPEPPIATTRGDAAPTVPTKGTPAMSRLADKIAAREAEVAALRDDITTLAGGDETAEVLVQIEEKQAALEGATKALDTLRRAQAAIAASAAPAGASGGSPGIGHNGGPAIIHARGATDPATLFFRAGVVHLRSFLERRSPDDIVRTNFGGAQDLAVLVKAASDPAMTGVQGWAAELVGQSIGGFIDLLRPTSVFFNLPISQFTFGKGKIKLPGRAPGKTLAGAFVGEGQPIPVKALGLVSTVLEPHKLGVISTFTREIQAMSDPAIEPLIRDAMIGDTRETIDTLFLDATAAVAGVRPAGLQNIAGANTAASAGTSLANVITDLRTAVAALTTANMGRSLVWIMNKQRVMSLALMTNAAGAFMFRDEIANGTLLGVPLLSSTSVPAEVVYLVDAAELAGAWDSVPQFDLSEQATLHMEDTAPLPIVDNATQAVTAHPVRSLFQTASIALRMLWDLTWTERRKNAIFVLTAVKW